MFCNNYSGFKVWLISGSKIMISPLSTCTTLEQWSVILFQVKLNPFQDVQHDYLCAPRSDVPLSNKHIPSLEDLENIIKLMWV